MNNTEKIDEPVSIILLRQFLELTIYDALHRHKYDINDKTLRDQIMNEVRDVLLSSSLPYDYTCSVEISPEYLTITATTSETPIAFPKYTYMLSLT